MFAGRREDGEPTSDKNIKFCAEMSWLDTNILALGVTRNKKQHHVVIWDTRTAEGASLRFKLRQRNTGLISVFDDRSQLLASTNHEITLFDTRMPHSRSRDCSTPVRSIPHVHEGPKLQFSTNGLGSVAAVDRDDMMQIYSIKTGRTLKCLGSTSQGDKGQGGDRVKTVIWAGSHTEDTGSSLLAYRGKDVLNWS
jgi:hypothetical protein